MDREEQDLDYGLDPRAGIWLIWGRFIEGKERAEEVALLARAAKLRKSLRLPAIATPAMPSH